MRVQKHAIAVYNVDEAGLEFKRSRHRWVQGWEEAEHLEPNI